MPTTWRALSSHSYLLQVDEACVLLDCGASSEGAVNDFGKQSNSLDDVAYIQLLAEIAPTLTLILLSHPLPSSIGWLPYLILKCNLSPACAIYASPPTIALARIAWRELYLGIGSELDPGLSTSTVRKDYSDAQLQQVRKARPWKFTAVQLGKVLSRISPIRFSSPLLLVGRNAPLTLLANRAGHTLGGTLWTLRTPTNEEITYVPAWNHVRERILDPASSLVSTATSAFAKSRRQKGIIIISSDRANLTAPKTNVKNKALIDAIADTLKSAHSVLIPVDAAARAVEIAVLLDQQWPFASLLPHPLCFVTRSKDDLQLALKNLQEYFGSNLTQALTGNSAGGLTITDAHHGDVLKNVRFFASVQDLDDAVPPNVARCVICAPSTLSYGFSRTLFTQKTFSQTAGNMVVLTSRTACEQGSLAEHLFQRWSEGQEGTEWGNDSGKPGHVVDLNGDKITLEMHKKVLLEGEELVKYMVQQKQEAQAKAKLKAVQDRKRRLEEAAEIQSDNEEDSSDEDADGIDDANDGESPAKRPKMDTDDNHAMQDITNLGGSNRRSQIGGNLGDAEVGATGTGINLNLDTEYGDPSTGQAPTLDLYVRGQYSRLSEYTTPIKQDDGQLYFPPLRDVTSARTRMFPFHDRRRKVDAYGEVVDVQSWLTRGRTEGETQVVEMSAINQTRKKRDEEAAKDRVEAPHKFTTEKVALTLNCSVLAIDLEGKADGKALKTLLPHLNPKRLILLAGEGSDAQDVKDSCLEASSMTRSILTPAIGEMVEIGDNVKSFSVRLDEDLLSSVGLKKVEDYEIARLYGLLSFTDISSIPTMLQASLESSERRPHSSESRLLSSFQRPDIVADGNMELDSPVALPSLDPALFIGDVRLAALRQRLQAQGVPAAFAGEGVLVCGPVASKNTTSKKETARSRLTRGAYKASATPDLEAADTAGGRVAVRKLRDGELLIEGSPGDTYQVVREMVYSLHAAAE